MKQIIQFRGHWRALSNFQRVTPFNYQDWDYNTAEHAYQCAKCLTEEDWSRIYCTDTPGKAKRLGQHVQLIPYWEDKKLGIMLAILRKKFGQNPARSVLLETGTAELIEGNTWGDTFWGQCPVGNGSNHLGRLLMQVRGELERQQLDQAVKYAKA